MRNHMIKGRSFLFIFFSFLFLVHGVVLHAQEDEKKKRKFQVKVINKMTDKSGKNSTKEIQEYVFYKLTTKSEAERIAKEIEDANGFTEAYDIAKRDLMFAKPVREDQWEKAISRTNRQGWLELPLYRGQAIVFVEQNLTHAKAVEITDQTEYKVELEVVRKDVVQIDAERIHRKVKGGGTNRKKRNGTQTFPVKFELSPGSYDSSSRLIIQVKAVDCLTEDTVGYCAPIVYEGKEYHTLQNKRKDYNYLQRDSLGKYYSNDIVLEHSDHFLMIDTTVTFVKPEGMQERNFKGPFTYSLENYHRVVDHDSWGGTCLAIDPLKFLDMTVAMADLNLADFEEQASENTEKKKTNLGLRFIRNTDNLTNDSINISEQQRLNRELSQVSNLQEISILATASPDGRDAHNEELARKRAERAKAIVASFHTGAFVHTETKVYQWQDLLARLKKKDVAAEEIAAVQEIVDRMGAGNQDAMDAEMKKLPFYEEVIVPVLEEMMSMVCTYSYLKTYIMTPDEVAERYYEYKSQGKLDSLQLSNGDYFNLFATVEEEDQDSVAILAYRHLQNRQDWEMEVIAPFVANRIAMLNLRSGVPDTTILKPFINSEYGKNVIDTLTGIKLNRPEILLNQAINYLQLQRIEHVTDLLSQLTKEEPVYKNEKTEKLEMAKDFVELDGSDDLNAEEEERYEAAKEFFLNSNDLNKAILYTEEVGWKMRDFAEPYVDKMDDKDPRKWYLKALLWAPKAGTKEESDIASETISIGKSEELIIPGFENFKVLSSAEVDELMITSTGKWNIYNDSLKLYNDAKKKYIEENSSLVDDNEIQEESSNLELTNIPHYLAYFQHSFDLEPKFMRYYYNEGHIDDEMRKKYKYKYAHIPAYRELFRQLMYYYKKQQEEESLLKEESKEEMNNEEEQE